MEGIHVVRRVCESTANAYGHLAVIRLYDQHETPKHEEKARFKNQLAQATSSRRTFQKSRWQAATYSAYSVIISPTWRPGMT